MGVKLSHWPKRKVYSRPGLRNGSGTSSPAASLHVRASWPVVVNVFFQNLGSKVFFALCLKGAYGLGQDARARRVPR